VLRCQISFDLLPDEYCSSACLLGFRRLRKCFHSATIKNKQLSCYLFMPPPHPYSQAVHWCANWRTASTCRCTSWCEMKLTSVSCWLCCWWNKRARQVQARVGEMRLLCCVTSYRSNRVHVHGISSRCSLLIGPASIVCSSFSFRNTRMFSRWRTRILSWEWPECFDECGFSWRRFLARCSSPLLLRSTTRRPGCWEFYTRDVLYTFFENRVILFIRIRRRAL